MYKKKSKLDDVKGIPDKIYYWILGGLVVLSIILRLYNLDFNSLWLDEATTELISSQSFGQIWQTTISGEFNPPLFYWMEHVMLMFGNNEFILRLLPALFGVATIPAIYFAGKEFIDRNVGIIAASAFTFSPFLIFYSQEARAYSAMLFFITVASIFYFKGIKTNESKDWIIFGVLSALAFWCHFYAIVVFIPYILYAIWIYSDEIGVTPNVAKGLLIATFLFTVISFLPLYAISELIGLRMSTGPTFGFMGLTLIMQTFNQLSGFSDLIMYLFLMLFAIGVFQVYITDKEKGIFFMWMMVSIFAVSYILSFKIPMLPRYLQFLNIIFFIGIASSYKIFQRVFKGQSIVYCFIVLFMVISIPFVTSYYGTYAKDDWRGFSGKLSNVTNDGDYVVFVPSYIQTPALYYYDNQTDNTIVFGAYNESGLSGIIRQNNSIYYVVTPDISAANPNGDAFDWLVHNTKVVWRDNNINLLRRE